MASASAPTYAPRTRTASRAIELLESWRYTGDKRDLRLDLLRGFAALAMVIDHVGGQNSWLYTISGGDRFFVSAAEGFVFISGLVMGIVYANILARQGLRAALRKCARRVATLYGLTVGLSLVFAAISSQLNLPWAPRIAAGGLPDFVIGILTLHRAYYLTDVLLLYTLVIAASLPLLVLLWRGYGLLVLAASWGLWMAWQWWPDQVQLPWVISDGSTFHFSSWQVLFITGLVLGYYRKACVARLTRILQVRVPVLHFVRVAMLVVPAILVGVSIALYFWNQAHPGNGLIGSQLEQIFGKPDVRLGRLAVFACIFAFAFALSTIAWTPLRKLLGWLLMPMGQDALTVYTLHLFVIVLLAEAMPKIFGGTAYSTLDNTIVQTAAIAIIWGLVMVKAPGKALCGAVYRRSQRRLAATLTACLSRRLAAGAVQLTLPGYASLASLRRLGAWKPLRFGFAGLAGLVIAGIVLISAGPALARVLTNRPSTLPAAAYSINAMPSASGTALPAPSGVASIAGEATPAPGTLLGSTAAPPPISGGGSPALPSYVVKRTFVSATLNRVMPYYVYLPPGYSASPNARYPVLYMLHGIGGSNDEWLGYGLLGRAYDMMRAGQISQFLIVLPQGDQGYWMDHADGGAKWGVYVAHDVVSEIDANFRTLADRQHRAIGGLSMGGYGALLLAITYPELFGVAGADSPSLHNYATAPPYFGDQAYFNAHDPAYLYKLHPDIARTLKLWIDDGQQDTWLPQIEAFHNLLQAEGIPHEWHIYPGAHTGEYWSTHVPDYLQFYSSALYAVAQTAPVVTSTSIPALPLPHSPSQTGPTRSTLRAL